MIRKLKWKLFQWLCENLHKGGHDFEIVDRGPEDPSPRGVCSRCNYDGGYVSY